jgi:hypothetical protein
MDLRDSAMNLESPRQVKITGLPQTIPGRPSFILPRRVSWCAHTKLLRLRGELGRRGKLSALDILGDVSLICYDKKKNKLKEKNKLQCSAYAVA